VSCQRADAEQAPGAGMKPLNVVSYNIRHGAGMDRRLDLARTAAVLKRLNADLVALQEVDKNCTRSEKTDQAAELGNLLGMEHAFGAFMSFQGGEYGLAVLSRFPILKAIRHVLPRGAEPRCALEIQVQPSGVPKPVSFVCVHMDWTKDSRRLPQMSTLLDKLATRPHPVILAGDFNAKRDEPSMQALYASGWTVLPKQGAAQTYPADKPSTEIDYIVTRGLSTNATSTVIAETIASDHRPLQAELHLKGQL